MYTHITHKYLPSYLNEFMFRSADAEMNKPVIERMELPAQRLSVLPAYMIISHYFTTIFYLINWVLISKRISSFRGVRG